MVVGINQTKNIVFNPTEDISIPMKQITGWYKLGLSNYNKYYYAKNGTHSEETDTHDIRLLVSYTCIPCNVMYRNTRGSSSFNKVNFYKPQNDKVICDAEQLLLFKKWVEEEILACGGAVLSANDFYSTSNIVMLVPSDSDPFSQYFCTTDYEKPDVINNGTYEGDFVTFDYGFADSEENLQRYFGTSVFKSNTINVTYNAYNNIDTNWAKTKNEYLGTDSMSKTFDIPDINTYFNLYSATTNTFLPIVGWNAYIISFEQVDTYKINTMGTDFTIDNNSYGITMVRVERDLVEKEN